MLGGGNVLVERSKAPLPRRTLDRAEAIYRERHAMPDGGVSATFEIVYLSGWAPDASQQKPLQPGSAAQRLADALRTTEQSAGDKASFPAARAATRNGRLVGEDGRDASRISRRCFRRPRLHGEHDGDGDQGQR